MGVITLIFIGYILEHLWWSPLVVAYVADVLIIIITISANLAWVLFIIYMGITCAENSIFPITPGFSYGWIMYLFNSVFGFFAVGTSIAGTLKMRKYKKEEDTEAEYQKGVIVAQSARSWPIYPEAPPSLNEYPVFPPAGIMMGPLMPNPYPEVPPSPYEYPMLPPPGTMIGPLMPNPYPVGW